jgi:hypothetical protein
MSSFHEPFEDSHADLENLEKIIRAARHFVVPSDDLRPRTLEDARDLGQKRREIRRLGLTSILGIALWGFSFSVVNSAGAFRDAWVTPSGEELRRIAFELGSASQDSHDWGLVEVFDQIRSLRVGDLEKYRIRASSPLNSIILTPESRLRP